MPGHEQVRISRLCLLSRNQEIHPRLDRAREIVRKAVCLFGRPSLTIVSLNLERCADGSFCERGPRAPRASRHVSSWGPDGSRKVLQKPWAAICSDLCMSVQVVRLFCRQSGNYGALPGAVSVRS